MLVAQIAPLIGLIKWLPCLIPHTILLPALKMTRSDVHYPTLSKPGARSCAYAPLYYFVFPKGPHIARPIFMCYNAQEAMKPGGKLTAFEIPIRRSPPGSNGRWAL